MFGSQTRTPSNGRTSYLSNIRITLQLALVVASLPSCLQHLAGATIPLPAWTFSASGPGSGGGGTNDSGDVNLWVWGPPSGTGTEVSRAVSATDILRVSTNTTYVFSAWATATGPSGPVMALLVNGQGVTTATPPHGSWAFCVAEFTTGGPSDYRVYSPLRAEATIGAAYGGGGTLTFGNMTLSVFGPQPELAIRRTNATQVQVSWRTNYTGFNLESASNLVGAPWYPVTNATTTQARDFVVTIDTLPASSRYFRLRTP